MGFNVQKRVESGSVRKPNLPDLGIDAIIFLKLTPMVQFAAIYVLRGECEITDACKHPDYHP